MLTSLHANSNVSVGLSRWCLSLCNWFGDAAVQRCGLLGAERFVIIFVSHDGFSFIAIVVWNDWHFTHEVGQSFCILRFELRECTSFLKSLFDLIPATARLWFLWSGVECCTRTRSHVELADIEDWLRKQVNCFFHAIVVSQRFLSNSNISQS